MDSHEGDVIAGLQTVWLVVFSFLGVLTCIIVAVYIEQMIYFARKKKTWKLREKAKWVLLVYPVIDPYTL